MSNINVVSTTSSLIYNRALGLVKIHSGLRVGLGPASDGSGWVGL